MAIIHRNPPIRNYIPKFDFVIKLQSLSPSTTIIFNASSFMIPCVAHIEQQNSVLAGCHSA